MATSTNIDTDSSASPHVSQSIGVHLFVLREMLQHMREEREVLPADALWERILLDLRIRTLERDIEAVRRALH
jgi:hypothetical protein